MRIPSRVPRPAAAVVLTTLLALAVAMSAIAGASQPAGEPTTTDSQAEIAPFNEGYPCADVMESTQDNPPLEFGALRGQEVPSPVWGIAKLGSVTCISDNVQGLVTAVMVDFAIEDSGSDAILLLPRAGGNVDWDAYLRETMEGSGLVSPLTSSTPNGAIFGRAGVSNQVDELEALLKQQPAPEDRRESVWSEIIRHRAAK